MAGESVKKPKILVVGSFMMDLISSAERVPNLGETVIGISFNTASGGKGANQAVQCARLGADVAMLGCVGKDSFGDEMLSAVSASGVDVRRVKRSGEHSSGVGNIQLQVSEQTAQNRIMVIPGANYDLKTEDMEWLREGIKEFDMLMLQLELSMDVTKFAARCAYEAGVPVMLNPAPACLLDKELLECITYLSPNEHEAALLSGHKLRADDNGVNKEDLKAVAAILKGYGADKIIITLGSNGSAIVNEDAVLCTDCVRMDKVVDPTAAGDSFIAAFCTGVASGLDEPAALRFASYTAAITVCGIGALPSLPELEQVKQLIRDRGDNELLESLKGVLA